jgi:exodeoxyribonuclease VIII
MKNKNHMKDKMIYIGCPYSHVDNEVRGVRFNIVSEITSGLVKRGYKVFSPITYGHTLCDFAEMPTDFNFWKDLCFKFLSPCDLFIVLELDALKESNGLKAEIDYCVSNDIDIISYDMSGRGPEDNIKHIIEKIENVEKFQLKRFVDASVSFPYVGDFHVSYKGSKVDYKSVLENHKSTGDNLFEKSFVKKYKDEVLENCVKHLSVDVIPLNHMNYDSIFTSNIHTRKMYQMKSEEDLAKEIGYENWVKSGREKIKSVSFDHVMIDIETLGTKANSVITSISAVRFSMETGVIVAELEVYVDIDSCLKYGLEIDGSTLKWWASQPNVAESIPDDCKDLKKSLKILSKFITKDDKVWGNSNRFDLGVLDNAYQKTGLSLPWNFRKERDVRTLVSFKPEIKENLEFKGTRHRGMDDLKHQVEYCHMTWKRLKYSK